MTLFEKYTQLDKLSKRTGVLGLAFATVAAGTILGGHFGAAGATTILSAVAAGTSYISGKKRAEACLAYVASKECPRGYGGVY